MNYSMNTMSKFEYAVRFIVMLFYVILHQKDAAGLIIVNDKVKHYLPPRSTGGYLKEILSILESLIPAGRTDLKTGINSLIPHLKKRGVVLFFSDFLCDMDDFFSELMHLRSYNQEIYLFHVMDNSELNFPFRDFANFKCLESENSYLAESKAIRDIYLRELNNHLALIRKKCLENYIKYFLLDTSFSVEEEVFGFLMHGRRNGI
jgi:uncharacterized protein (DUF58 family)